MARVAQINWAWRALELLVAAVFIYAGVLKALDPVGFANDIENYHIVPWPIGVRAAFYLPWLEIFCGLALVFRRAHRGALAILGGLTVVFMAASIVAKARGIDVSCGCFGHAARNLSFASHLAIDVVILIAITVVMLRPKNRIL
jgi:putative oxidoreductase